MSCLHTRPYDSYNAHFICQPRQSYSQNITWISYNDVSDSDTDRIVGATKSDTDRIVGATKS